MKITRDDLRWAASQGVIQAGQDEALWRALEQRGKDRPRFDAAHLAYYAGALIVIAAMGWLLTKAWDQLPGLALSGIAAGYAVIFVIASGWLWDRLGLRVPGGLLLTMAVCMTPMAIYGVLRQYGLWPSGDPGSYRGFHIWVKGSWIALELGTVLAGVAALRFRRFAFIAAPIAVALWYLSMDLAPLLLGGDEGGLSYRDRAWVSLWFGLVMLVVAYAIDLRGRDEDFAFWIYLGGLCAFWGGLSGMDTGSELGKFFYLLVNLALIAVSLVLRRVMFVVFGALGALGYLGHLAYRVFEDSFLFPVALTALGLSIIALGVIYHRNRGQIERQLQARIPAGLRNLLPPRARG
jgi:hypothetical protein